MTRAGALTAALALLLASPPGAAAGEWPDWVERWLFNGEERTGRALEATRRGSAEEALRPLETALRLADENPVALYNAGTGRLAAGLGDPSALLAEAAESSRADLVPSAHYNLGNFRLAQDDFSGAIEAYKSALKADPDLADAKFNLELARRLLKEQQDQQRQEPQDQQQDQQDSENQQDEQQQEQEQDQQQQKQQQEEQQEEGQERQEQEEQQQQQQEGPLPEFRDLPDMTAEEAAAILEAVENMERERRRKQAQEAAKKSARGKKDW